MTRLEIRELLSRIVSRLRVVDDAISRARDNTEQDCLDDVETRYVDKQLAIALERLNEGVSLCLELHDWLTVRNAASLADLE